MAVIGRGMDFPNVTLVLQVGLPMDADSYTHRVGRTARAGKDGRAVLLLTHMESFFLKVNRQFPIKPYPASDRILNDVTSRSQIFNALQAVGPESKRKAYSAYLGFMKGYAHKMAIDAASLVKMANAFAIDGMQCSEVPEIDKRTIAKMGLKGVPGIRFSSPSQDDHLGKKRGPPAQDHAGPTDTFANSNRQKNWEAGASAPKHRWMGRGKTGVGRIKNREESNPVVV